MNHRTPPCPHCGHVHTIYSVTHAAGRFHPNGPLGYTTTGGTTIHPTREQAEAEHCQQRQRGGDE